MSIFLTVAILFDAGMSTGRFQVSTVKPKLHIPFRVERFVTSPLPHRPVRAAFPHTVPLNSASLIDSCDKLSRNLSPCGQAILARSAICNSCVDINSVSQVHFMFPSYSPDFKVSPFPARWLSWD
jgi:hypothetical protein